MKIIEALKLIKDLERKKDDLYDKVREYCVDLDCDTPTYPDQQRQISEWIQSYSDILKNILHLKYSISKTNIKTEVPILLGNKTVVKTIAEWILRRRGLAEEEQRIWSALHDKNLSEQYIRKFSDKSPEIVIKRRLYFDPAERDRKRELFRSEPSKIDAALEIVNATTDLIED